MREVPQTCPVINRIINELKSHITTNGQGTFYSISEYRMSYIIDLLEEVRTMNADLRYNADFYKKLYQHFRFGEPEYNPEVLPK